MSEADVTSPTECLRAHLREHERNLALLETSYAEAAVVAAQSGRIDEALQVRTELDAALKQREEIKAALARAEDLDRLARSGIAAAELASSRREAWADAQRLLDERVTVAQRIDKAAKAFAEAAAAWFALNNPLREALFYAGLRKRLPDSPFDMRWAERVLVTALFRADPDLLNALPEIECDSMTGLNEPLAATDFVSLANDRLVQLAHRELGFLGEEG